MEDITDITIGSVFKWKEELEHYLILFRTTSRISFYTDGNRRHYSYIIFENHPCFERRSVTSEIDIYYDIEANRLYNAFNNQHIEKLCTLQENEVNKLKEIFINSYDIPPAVKNKKIIDWLEFLISIME